MTYDDDTVKLLKGGIPMPYVVVLLDLFWQGSDKTSQYAYALWREVWEILIQGDGMNFKQYFSAVSDHFRRGLFKLIVDHDKRCYGGKLIGDSFTADGDGNPIAQPIPVKQD